MDAKILFDYRKPAVRSVIHEFTLKENRDFLGTIVGIEDAIREEMEKIPKDTKHMLNVMFNVYFNQIKKQLLEPYISILERETATNAQTLEAVKSTIEKHQDDNRNHE